MGVLRITVEGSFKPSGYQQEFSAMDHGHADAVAQAIEWLAAKVLPAATAQDHRLQAGGHQPHGGFQRKEPSNG